jgi:AAA+ ATPase superfamily predicted ATPase
MKPNNPFLISGYYSPEFFCDREQEAATILDALHNGRNLTLISPRRMGKTGLIRHVFYLLKEQNPDIVTLYLDIYATQSLGDFVRLLANTVLGKLDSAPQKALNRVSQFLRSCRPVITFEELTGLPKITIDVAPTEEERTLKEIFDYLGSSEKRCYIAIDEFQQIAEYPETGVEALLRSYIQFLPNVSFIFAGSRQHVMQEMFTSSKKPFYQSTQLLTLDSIDQNKYAEFAIAHFDKNSVQLPRAVFDAIYEKFSGHTWYVQCLLNRLYGYNRNVNMELVAYATAQITGEMSYSYADLLKAYSAGHIRLIKAIAKEGAVKEVLSGTFISKYNLRASSSVSSALKKLLNNEIVYQSKDGYIVYDRFMNEWLRSQLF